MLLVEDAIRTREEIGDPNITFECVGKVIRKNFRVLEGQAKDVGQEYDGSFGSASSDEVGAVHFGNDTCGLSLEYST